MPHFFITSDKVKEKTIIVDSADNFKHIAKSLRASVGEKLLLIDENEIEYNTKIIEISKNEIKAQILSYAKSERKLKFQLDLAQSPLRSEAQATIVEKATELGVNTIYPIYTDNCALKKNVIESKIEKWQNIMYAASKQCERANIPTCAPLTNLQDVIKGGYDKILALCERYTDKSLKEYFSKQQINENEKVLIIIGPEGGFSDSEFEFFRKNDIPMLSLGDLILKAETAVIVSIGNIVYEFNK